MNKPMTRACIRIEREKQIVFRARACYALAIMTYAKVTRMAVAKYERMETYYVVSIVLKKTLPSVGVVEILLPRVLPTSLSAILNA